jgi:hypothetical protein
VDEGGGGVGLSIRNSSTSNVEASSRYDENVEGGEEGDGYDSDEEG